jgi:molecular chaperone HscB
VKFDTDYFKLFGQPPQFSIDQKQLKKRSRELLRQYHPDRYIRASVQEQRLAVQFTAHINTAFSTLMNPVSRAQHLLALRGYQASDQNQTERDPEFLMQQMEMRESIESAASNNDVEHLVAIAATIDSEYAAVQKQFSTTDAVNLQASAVAKMQFYDKLQSEVAALIKR